VWGIGLLHRYRYDAFFRTQVHIIVLQVVFVAVILAFFTVAFEFVYKKMASSLVQGIFAAILSKGTFTAAEVLADTNELRDAYFAAVIASAAFITAVFGYMITRVALAPARVALASQKRFISDIAHELRTPISIIKTNSEVALLDEGLDEEMRRTHESNIEELDRTSDIINNLLTFSNWSSPERISFETVDLARVVVGAVAKLAPLAAGKSVTVTVPRRESVHLVGNVAALEQIAANLIKNAINYTPAGGSVTVTVEPDYRRHAVLTVLDTGIGIDERDLAHIFEPFYRAERSRSRESGSSGLGLTIVSELVKIHRGKITVRSELNRGTQVVITIPQNGAQTPEPERRGAVEDSPTIPEVTLDFFRRYF